MKNVSSSVIELTAETSDCLWQQRIDFYEKHKKPSDFSLTEIASYQNEVAEQISKNSTFTSGLIFSDDDLKAVFSFYLAEAENNSHAIRLDLTMDNLGFDSSLFLTLLNFIKSRIADQYQINIMLNCKVEDKTVSYLKLQKSSEVDVCILKREDLDYNLLQEWRLTAKKNNPDIRLNMFMKLPNEIIDEYSALFTGLLNNMPQPEMPITYNITGDETRKLQTSTEENGNRIYRLIAFDQQNRMVAISNVRILKQAYEFPYQFMTGAINEYRGRGLGKWFKSVMYPQIFADCPEVKGIVSEMLPHNHQIQAINRQIGYRKIGIRCNYFLKEEDYRLISLTD